MLEHALKYHKAGFNILPMRIEYDEKEKKFLKKANVFWKRFQTEKQTEDEIREWWTKWPTAMIGMMTGEINGIYAIDCDSEESYQIIQEMLPDTFITPTVLSAGGGHHLWVKCSNNNKLPTKTKLLPDLDTRGDGGIIVAPPSRNEISGKTYQWLEGLSIWDGPPQEVPLNILSTLLGDSKGGGISKDYTTQTYTDYIILHEGSRDQDLFEIGMSLADGKYKRDRIIQVLDMLAKNCVPPFPEKELQEKIKSIFARISSKDRNLMDEVREWCLLQKGSFKTTDVRHDLQITTKSEIKNLSVIINRLQEQGMIEKFGDVRGAYRTKDEKDKMEMRFIEEDIPEFNIKLPFGLSNIVSIYPKNIIVIAGSKSAGKTSLLLRIVMDNRATNEIVYLNSEMGDEEWSVRLKKFGIFKQSDMRFKALGVNKNFHDMMDESKKIFIVDFLEIHKDFFEVAKPIRLIHEAIKNGICIIAIQKKQGELLARGGEFSMEKSRLYLSLDFLKDQRCTQMTIVDAKSPKIPESPRDWTKRIKITDGVKMEAIDRDWRM